MVLIKYCVLAWLLGLGPTKLWAQQITLIEDSSHVYFGELIVEGINWSVDEWKEMAQDPQNMGAKYLQVYVGKHPPGHQQPAIWGKYAASEHAMRFKPRFPFEFDQDYYFRFEHSQHRTEGSFRVEDRYPVTRPRLLSLEPQLSIVPANILRFYLYFSTPMRRNSPYQYIHLIDQQGDTVKQAFFPADPPLWDRQGKRLTLLFDPGRIKSGLDSHEAWGLALKINQQYNLVVEEKFSSYLGQTLSGPVSHSFVVGPVDAQSPQIKNWKISAPRAYSQDYLMITFDEPMDRAQAMRWIQVQQSQEKSVKGKVHFSDEGNWVFRPDLPWEVQPYEILVNNQLEDLAGNSLRKPFEMSAGGTETMAPVGWITRPFHPVE